MACFTIAFLLLAGREASAQRAGIKVPACSDVAPTPVPGNPSASPPGSHDPDADGDGIDDMCELALARAFAPILSVRSGGCDWDDSVQPARLGGGYRYAVQRTDSVTRIAYLPAYFRDCGWSGLKCRVPGVDCSSHDGDSEFIALDLHERSGAWTITGVFLSAHCFGRSGKDCRWYRGQELSRFEWQDGAPIIWVAEGRHANYPGKSACDRGHHAIDTCDRHDTRYRFPIASGAQNIGSASAQGDVCVPGRDLGSTRAGADLTECFWQRDARFRGWQPGATGVTGYWRYLRDIAGFTHDGQEAGSTPDRNAGLPF